MKKSTIIMLVVAIVAVAGTQFRWWWSALGDWGV
ncbi:protein YoaJ, partial [Klebsiella pneumoniae]